MTNTIKVFLNPYLRRLKFAQKTSGFTLIELLVAMIIAFVIIGPLMGFMLNTLNTDRKEQAKATSEQEIQSALDFIAQDLDQAVYIYDADGLTKNSTDNPPGIKDQIPPTAAASGCNSTTPTCVPVLVFWKRKIIPSVLPVTGNTSQKNDTFVYSLVVYYLIQGNNSNGTWSNAARIGRFEIYDGVRDPTNKSNYIQPYTPSQGFQLFNLTTTGTNLKDIMNRWTNNGSYGNNQAFTLVDFIDQNSNGLAIDCTKLSSNAQQVPTTIVGGFYACVDSSTTSAQIYIRGNALARIQNIATYNSSQSIYFPTASIQIKGRGFLSTN